jgi:hypothetical protein
MWSSGLTSFNLQVYAERRTMPSAILRGLIPAGPTGVPFGIVHRPCNRPLSSSMQQLHRAAACPTRVIQSLDRRQCRLHYRLHKGNYAERHSDGSLHSGRHGKYSFTLIARPFGIVRRSA